MRSLGLKKTGTLSAAKFALGTGGVTISVVADVPVPEGRIGLLLGTLPGATVDSSPPMEVLGGMEVSGATMVLMVPVSNSCLSNSITKQTKLETTTDQNKEVV